MEPQVPNEIPKVSLYVSDKVWLGVFLVVQAALFIGASKLPTNAQEAVVWSAMLIGSIGVPLLMRLIPTPRQAGALRIASAAIKRLPTQEIAAMVDRDKLP